MSGLRKMERDRTRADLASVNAILDQLTDEDVMTRLSLESRREELLRSIATLEEVEERAASAALFFGGRPVAGARGIESEFGGNAISKFQDLLAKLLAEEGGSRLGQRGVVPNKAAATLHVTNVVRGSFGFLFEQIEPQQELVDTPLKIALERASQVLKVLAKPDEEEFRKEIETVDQRVLATLGEFFGLMRQNGATLRLVAGEADTSFGTDDVARAAERATSTAIEDTEETVEGELAGVLPDAHQFEFRAFPPRGTVLRGRVERAIPATELTNLNRALVGVSAKARVRVRRVRQHGQVVRESFTLLGIEKV
jgi:hypothetical protein